MATVEPSVQGHSIGRWEGDGDYLAEPVGYELEWVYSPDFELVRLPCDPESAQRYLDLQ